jgi:CubicO group peptidase (beta-lactamase class C family)
VIRFVDIATHHSGLPGMPDNFSPADMTNPYADYTTQMMFEFINGHELRRDVGAEFEYSNLAVGLMGHLLALKNGTDYEALVKERIIEPLGMDKTGISLTAEMERQFVKGHNEAGEVTPPWDLPTLAGAGALRSDMNDMLDFIEANVGEPNSDLERVMRVTHEVRQTMGGPASIGLNWIVRAVGDDRIVWHNGGTGGFRTWAGFDPELGVGAVVLTNSSQSADDIGVHLINPAVPLAPAPEPRAEHIEVEVDRSVMERYVGVYELAPNITLTVALGDSGLSVQLTGQGPLELFAESETLFFLKAVEAQVEFVIEGDEVAAVIMHQAGQAQRANKTQ